MKRLFLAAGAAAALASPAAAATTIFLETFDGVRPGHYAAGETIGQFTIGANDLDIIGDLGGANYSCPNGPGNNCVDTNGNAPATFFANVGVVEGATYRISFDMAGNGPRAGASQAYVMRVAFGGASEVFTVAAGAPYVTQSFTFVAASTGDVTLSLASQNDDQPDYWGALVDNVKVDDLTPSAAPEPAAWALMVVGFGGVGALARRRRVASDLTV